MVATPVWPPENTRGEEIAVRDLLEHIEAHGVAVTWERAIECACVSATTGYDDQARPNCPLCGGLRFEYLPAISTLAIVTPLDRDAKLVAKLGQWATGRATITLHPDQLSQARDRISLIDARMRVSAFVRRAQSGTKDTLRLPVAVQSFNVPAPAPGATIQQGVVQLRLRLPNGEAGPTRAENVDFAIDAQGRIDWALGIAKGTAPAAGQSYVVAYYARPRYIIESIPHVVRAGRLKVGFPERITRYLPTESIGLLDSVAALPYT